MKTNSLWIVGGKIDFLAVKHSLIGGAFFVWTLCTEMWAT